MEQIRVFIKLRFYQEVRHSILVRIAKGMQETYILLVIEFQPFSDLCSVNFIYFS